MLSSIHWRGHKPIACNIKVQNRQFVMSLHPFWSLVTIIHPMFRTLVWKPLLQALLAGKNKSAGLLLGFKTPTHSARGAFVIIRAPSNPLPSEPAPVLATVHTHTHTHYINTPDTPVRTCFQTKDLGYVITWKAESSILCQCFRMAVRFVIHEFIAGNHWSRSSH